MMTHVVLLKSIMMEASHYVVHSFVLVRNCGITTIASDSKTRMNDFFVTVTHTKYELKRCIWNLFTFVRPLVR